MTSVAGAADGGAVEVDRHRRRRPVAAHAEQRGVLEDQHRVGVAERGRTACRGRPRAWPAPPPGARGCGRTSPRGCGECWAASWRPAPVVMRITSGTLNWPPDMCRKVAALFRIWSSASRLKLTVMISTIGRMPAQRRADAGADERRLRQRRVAHPLGAELLEQAEAHGEGAAVARRRPRPSGTRGRRRPARRAGPRAAPRGSVVIGTPAAPPSLVGTVDSSEYTQRVELLDRLERRRLGEGDGVVDLGRRRSASMPSSRRRRRARPSSAAIARATRIGSRSFHCSISALSR